MKIGITGCIGSGKSYICKLLGGRGFSIYNCDNEARRLINEDMQIRTSLIKAVGENVYKDGYLDKSVLTNFILGNKDNALIINNIVHPVVANDFLSSGMSWMECALLFSSGFHKLVDKVICVSAPLSLRINRIMLRDSVSHERAEEWINCQMSQDEIMSLSDFVIKNDGSSDLNNQIDEILNTIIAVR